MIISQDIFVKYLKTFLDTYCKVINLIFNFILKLYKKILIIPLPNNHFCLPYTALPTFIYDYRGEEKLFNILLQQYVVAIISASQKTDKKKTTNQKIKAYFLTNLTCH